MFISQWQIWLFIVGLGVALWQIENALERRIKNQIDQLEKRIASIENGKIK